MIKTEPKEYEKMW